MSNLGMKKQPKLFRIQYQIEPMRAVFESFIEHIDDRYTEADYIAGFKMMHQRAVVRKTEWISQREKDFLDGTDDERQDNA